MLLSGGETTVTVRGSGRGGRNQEFALWLLHYLGRQGVWAISAGSDGVDGNSEAAGAVLRPDSWQRAREMGLERFQDWDEEQMRNHPSSSAVIDVIIGYEGWLEQCTMALSAHRSQVRLDDDFWRFFQIMREQEGGGEAFTQATRAALNAAASDRPPD